MSYETFYLCPDCRSALLQRRKYHSQPSPHRIFWCSVCKRVRDGTECVTIIMAPVALVEVEERWQTFWQ